MGPHCQPADERSLIGREAAGASVLAALEGALPTDEVVPARLARATPQTRRQSLLTLLFLPVVGLQRTRDLRGYIGDALALLTGQRRAYGFWWVERFLAQVALFLFLEVGRVM